MHFLFILLNLLISLNASILTLPTLDDWTSRCLNAPELNQMPGLKEFLLEGQKTHFETFCRNNRIANWAEITMVKNTFQDTLNERLTAGKWVNPDLFKPHEASLYNGYYVGLNVLPETKFYCWGNRHGDARSLLLGLNELQKQGIIIENAPWDINNKDIPNDPWIMRDGHIPVLLGDYVNNGCYSLEAAMTAMILYIKNKHCIAIRGNHECTDRPVSLDWAIREATVKLTDELGDKAAHEALLFFQLLEKLPAAAFASIVNPNEDSKNIAFVHATPDLGINPKLLIEALQNLPVKHINKLIYCAIDPKRYNRRSDINPCAKAIINDQELQKSSPYVEEYLNVTRESEPRSLALCRDQLINENPETPFEYLRKITTLAWGLPLIKAIMKDWNIFCIIRSHQHAHALDCKKDPSLFYPMIQLWDGRGTSLAWRNDPYAQTEVAQNDVITVQVAPDSIYGLSESQITGEPQTNEMYPGFHRDTIATIRVTLNGTLILEKIHITTKAKHDAKIFNYNGKIIIVN